MFIWVKTIVKDVAHRSREYAHKKMSRFRERGFRKRERERERERETNICKITVLCMLRFVHSICIYILFNFMVGRC